MLRMFSRYILYIKRLHKVGVIDRLFFSFFFLKKTLFVLCNNFVQHV